jgi:predicted Co/Zn/Cd cation transporter (cation efflux family)
MNTAEGFNRVAKIIVILGWIIGAILFYSLLNEIGGAVILGGGSVAVGYGIAWIITGFTAPKKEG